MNSSLLELSRKLPPSLAERLISKFIMAHLDGTSIPVKTCDGFSIWCDPSDFIQKTIIQTGMWDYEVADAIRTHLKPGQTFCDIGANIGYFSMLAARMGANVIAFEPQPACAQAFRRNADLNRLNITLHEMALSSEPGQMNLYLEGDRNTGAASFRFRNGEVISVPVNRLDDVLTIKPHLIKIDIEGAEVLALRGAKQTLSGADRPKVICEVSEFSLRQLGSSKDELFDLMSSYGYQAQVISKVRRSNASTRAVYFQYDTLFTPSD